ncbi:hypothetical protein WN093_02050 [Gammaproteobacteria bacterium AS21]|jgi:hypothetical protein
MLNQQENTYNNATINNAENVAICMMQDNQTGAKKELRLVANDKNTNSKDAINDNVVAQITSYDFVGVAG